MICANGLFLLGKEFSTSFFHFAAGWVATKLHACFMAPELWTLNYRRIYRSNGDSVFLNYICIYIQIYTGQCRPHLAELYPVSTWANIQTPFTYIIYRSLYMQLLADQTGQSIQTAVTFIFSLSMHRSACRSTWANLETPFT